MDLIKQGFLHPKINKLIKQIHQIHTLNSFEYGLTAAFFLNMKIMSLFCIRCMLEDRLLAVYFAFRRRVQIGIVMKVIRMIKIVVRQSIALMFSIVSMLAINSAHAKQTMCVFDLQGTSGDMFALMRDYAVAAQRWGADLQLRAYTNERVATEDFKASQCDAVFFLGIRGRQFNSFTGSIDAFGAVPSNATALAVMRLMAHPKLAADMVEGKY